MPQIRAFDEQRQIVRLPDDRLHQVEGLPDSLDDAWRNRVEADAIDAFDHQDIGGTSGRNGRCGRALQRRLRVGVDEAQVNRRDARRLDVWLEGRTRRVRSIDARRTTSANAKSRDAAGHADAARLALTIGDLPAAIRAARAAVDEIGAMVEWLERASDDDPIDRRFRRPELGRAVERNLEALALARSLTPANGLILATGSIYLIGAIREIALT